MSNAKYCTSISGNPSSFYGPSNDPKSFAELCHKIESDPNYRLDITDEELLALVIDENGVVRNNQCHQALAITKIDAHPQSPSSGESLGNLYQVKVALKGCIENSDEPIWHVDDSVVIYVRKNGPTTFHTWLDVLKGELKRPCDHLTLGQFLTSPKKSGDEASINISP